MRDDHHYQDRLQLWTDFNLCWLAVCQKQKDMTHDFIATGRQSIQVNLLSRDRMENMGRDLIQLCDQLEQYGLVDYEMGIWEEEILCGEYYPTLDQCLQLTISIVLGQCLDQIESRPELHRIQTALEPAKTAPRQRS